MPWQKQVLQKQLYTAAAKARCLECQLPTCSHCGQKPTAHLNTNEVPKSRKERDEFICRTCRYPACSACDADMNETQKRKWRKRLLEPGTAWTCPTCTANAFGEAFPQCSKCGTKPKALLHHELRPKNRAECDAYLCEECKYPNCSKCNSKMGKMARELWRQKPGSTWTCQSCSRNAPDEPQF